MRTSTLPRYVLGAAILVILLIFAVKLVPTHKAKPATNPTAKQVAENECAQQIYTKYVKDKFALSQSRGDALFPSVDEIITERRLEEQFCLQFIRCFQTAPTTDSDTDNAVKFHICLRDEALEDYDAVSREDTNEDDAQ
jgi:hypothetical protein